MAASEAPRIVPLTPDDKFAIIELNQWAFGHDVEGFDPEPAFSVFEWDRTFGAVIDSGGKDQLVGINTTYSQQLPVPGGSLACAGLTWVGVHPQFRRRGVLTRMIGQHLEQAAQRGEPVSALHASETVIYGRFGYGMAGRHVYLDLNRGAALRPVSGTADVPVRIERADADRHADLVGDCYLAARQSRPGMVSRDTPAFRRAMLDDQPKFREGAEPLAIMIAESASPDQPVRGYALFRRKASWDNKGLPTGQVQLRELVARDPAAGAALWSRVLDLDLTSTVQTDARPLDDPLLHLLENPRQAKQGLFDGLFIRLVDVPTALAGRRYSAPVDVVLEVSDPILPANAGRWRLQGGPDGARCTATDQPAQLALDVRELSAGYLGSTSLLGLAEAGLLQVPDPAMLQPAAIAFSWPVAAWSGWEF